MAIALTQTIQTQISNKNIKPLFVFKIDGVDYSAYVMSWDISEAKDFGSTSAIFVLNNDGGIFGESGVYKIEVGDVISFVEKYADDVTEFPRFYGKVEQRGITVNNSTRTITINCLDTVGLLQKIDIDLDIEGTKVKIEEETLTPNYLPVPKERLSQVFDFANKSVAQVPPPSLTIRPKAGMELVDDTPQFDGFDIKYAEGQVQLGTPINTVDNYDLIATTYFFYSAGVYVEDIIETILTTEDVYGDFLYGELTAQAVIDNHLTDTFSNLTGGVLDTLTPNITEENIRIRTSLTTLFDPDVSGTDLTTIEVASTTGFPTSGTGTINGDTFTWTGKTGLALTGISESGSNALKAHPINSVVEYRADYAIGRVWFLKYSNIQSTLLSGEFSGIPGGVTIDYIDYRYGRIILSEAISITTVLTHSGNYTFKTIQATGIELNGFKINAREVETRFDALKKLKEYVAPNYSIRTRGDDKIWSSYLTQSPVADYTLNLVQNYSYLEDEEIYTHVKFYGKNNNPTNVLFREGVEFITTGADYKALANQTSLTWEKEEGNYQVYKTAISDAGRILLGLVTPLVYINNVPVNNVIQRLPGVPVRLTVTNTTEQQSDNGGNTITIYQKYYYRVHFPNVSLMPTNDILLYDSAGTLVFTIVAGNTSMNYATGVYTVPELGTVNRSDGYSLSWGPDRALVESFSTATYYVLYSTSNIVIDYDTVRFKISKDLIANRDLVAVSATFQYLTAINAVSGISALIDGSFSTQVQTVFFAEPPAGLQYAILDLGETRTIQAIDITSGFYQPDEVRKYDVDFKISLQYSLDNVDYYVIGAKTTNFDMSSGNSQRFEEEDLGYNFQARYLMIVLEEVKRIDFGEGVWVVALTEMSVYDDIILKSEATLTPTTELTVPI